MAPQVYNSALILDRRFVPFGDCRDTCAISSASARATPVVLNCCPACMTGTKKVARSRTNIPGRTCWWREWFSRRGRKGMWMSDHVWMGLWPAWPVSMKLRCSMSGRLRRKTPSAKFKQADLVRPVEGMAGYCDSLSCLHALEHFGLGRYGDPIDPKRL